MNSLFSHLRVAVIGFLMGCADVVPGVSGGTIAFICGIYERLINGIKSFDLTSARLLLQRDFKDCGLEFRFRSSSLWGWG